MKETWRQNLIINRNKKAKPMKYGAGYMNKKKYMMHRESDESMVKGILESKINTSGKSSPQKLQPLK